MTEYKEQIKKLDHNGIGYIFDQILEDLIHPFMDPREDKQIVRTFIDQKFPNEELFYCLIDETKRTFKEGMIVSATVFRVYESNDNMPARILCRLENGLDANINENDADFFNGPDRRASVEMGSIITGRIDQIKFTDKNQGDENFSVILKCKKADLEKHDRKYIDKNEMMEIPDEDLRNINFKIHEE